MKTFNDLKVGDDVWYLDSPDDTILHGTVADVKDDSMFVSILICWNDGFNSRYHFHPYNGDKTTIGFISTEKSELMYKKMKHVFKNNIICRIHHYQHENIQRVKER